jgi:hypothetical protein
MDEPRPTALRDAFHDAGLITLDQAKEVRRSDAAAMACAAEASQLVQQSLSNEHSPSISAAPYAGNPAARSGALSPAEDRHASNWKAG